MTIDQFVTVEKSNPDYSDLMHGFDKSGRIPLPVQSPGFQQTNQFTTFQFVLPKSLKRPHLFPLILKAVRIEMLPFTLGPALVAYFLADPELVNLSRAGILFLSLIFLHIGVFCLNDYFDHIVGVDRVNEKGGSRVIQEGWLRAWQVRNLGILFMTLSALVAIPVFIYRPELLAVALATLVLLAVGYFFSRGKRKIPVLGLAVLFLLFGPALSLGTFWYMNGAFDRDAWAFGTLLGMITVSYVFNRQILTLVVDQMAGNKTLPVQFGVDLSRKLLMMGIGFISIATIGHIAAASLIWGIVTALVFVLPVRNILSNLIAAKSPISSAMEKSRKSIQSFYLVSVGVMSLYVLCKFLVFAP